MCRDKVSIDVKSPSYSSPKLPSSPLHHYHKHRKQPTPNSTTTYDPPLTNHNKLHSYTASSSASHSSRHSISSIRSSLPDSPHLYDISEIRTATNNFLAKSLSKSSRFWRSELHGKSVVIFPRKSHISGVLRPSIVRQKLSSICKSHHTAVINLLGASISGDYIYLVYEFVNGSSLSDLLGNKNNPEYTVLNTWMSRMQIATDLANGLDYIHNNTGLDMKYVHNHIKSSSIIVTEPYFNAKICHFGTAELCSEPTDDRERDEFDSKSSHKLEDIIDETEENAMDSCLSSTEKKSIRTNSVKFNGTPGYMSLEFQSTGIGTRKSDVYAFGVVMLELLSGEEAVKYKYNKAKREYIRVSVVDAARAILEVTGLDREAMLRKWMDPRLKDSYPVEVADKLTRLAVDCLHVDPDKRPDMRRIAGKISRLYLESQIWCDKLKYPTDITVSFAPR
ncbi:unnamed protein product [Amaranthus hypochondriacus]